METEAVIEVGDKRQSVKLLTQHLEKAFERRSRMGRMDALDIESLPDEADGNSSCLNDPTDADIYLNNNHVITSSPGFPGNTLHQCSTSLTELNNNNNSCSEEVITHKPPKYPSLPLKSRQLSKDDPFSACFEDAIGDNIVEDTELEWDHSPDMDIHGDLSEGVEVDDLPLPPPPPALLTGERPEYDEEPLPPPPPPQTETEEGGQASPAPSGTSREEGMDTDPVLSPVSAENTDNTDSQPPFSDHTSLHTDSLSSPSQSFGYSSISTDNTDTETPSKEDTNVAANSLTSFENVVVCETPVINNSMSDSLVDNPTQASLDTSVSSTDGSGTHGDIDDSFACNNMATIVRPKSQSLKNRRPHYENVANDQGPLSLDTKRAASAYYDHTVDTVANGEVRLDQTPPPHSLYFKLPHRPAHHYEEIDGSPVSKSAVYFESNEEIPLRYPEQVPSDTSKKSPSTPGAKKVLFQLPGPNEDTEEVTQDEPSVPPLMHSQSYDAVLRSPNPKVTVPELRSKSPVVDSSSRREAYRHSTPAVLHKVQPPVVNTTFSSSDSSTSSVSHQRAREGLEVQRGTRASTGTLKHRPSGTDKTGQTNHTLAGGRLLSKLKRCEARKEAAVRQGDSVHGSADSDDSYFTDSDFDDDYNDVYNIDEDGLSSTSDFTSYSDETTPRSPQAGSHEMDSCYDVMLELLKTEKAYVDRLHFLCRVVLLNVKVLNNVQDVHILPPDAVSKIFSNIERIFSLHTSTVLPLVEERVTNWKLSPRVDDIVREFLPHLVLYHEFVGNFTLAMSSITLWMEKCPVFQKLIQEVEKTPECRRMKVKQHFLEVVQRVPRYLDLLKSYTSHIQDRSSEKDTIKEVLSSLSQLVNELEHEMGKTERMKHLRSVQQKLDSSAPHIVSPLRELIKEGRLKSICAKTAKKLDRHLFLMDDLLLICTPSGLGGKLKLKFTLPVDKMQVHDSDNLVIPFTFYVQSKTRAIEFHCLSLEDKLCWVTTMQSAVDEFTKKKLLSQPVSVIQKTIPEEDVGRVAPRPESPQGQPLCYICKAGLKKVNNCRGCGMLVCQKCSSHKMKLDYEQSKPTRVCDECFVLISNRDLLQAATSWEVPHVGPSDPCNIAGYLQLSFNKGHSWHKRWITLHTHGVLYSFKSFKDHQVVGSLTLKRFSFSQTSKGDDIHKPTTFKIFNARRTYYFQADNADAVCKWMDALADLCDRKS